MFHFYISIHWYSTLSHQETYDFYVSFLVSMFHSKNTDGEKQKYWGSDSKTLRERESAPSVFWKMKHETKNETLKSYVSFSKWLIFNYFITKNETWKINQKFWKCMDIMWDKLQFKSCESLMEFCNFAHGFEFWVLFFITSKLFIFRDIRKYSKLFYAINSASNSKSEIWVIYGLSK